MTRNVLIAVVVMIVLGLILVGAATYGWHSASAELVDQAPPTISTVPPIPTPYPTPGGCYCIINGAVRWRPCWLPCNTGG